MKLHFYGTGASEGVPGLFCECECCKNIRKLGGKNFRTRTASMVDARLLIDFSSDIYAQTLFRGLELSKINHVLITHSHTDHFYAPGFMQCAPPMAFYERDRTLNVYGNQKVTEALTKELENYPIQKYLRPVELNSYDTFSIEDYCITALPANHDPHEPCLLYVIQRKDTALLYAHDTGIFSEDLWKALKSFKFSCVVLDCTSVEKTGVFPGHMGLGENVMIRERMLKEKMADTSTLFISTHFVHTFNPIHERITPIFKDKGFIAAYDGLEVDF